MKCCSSASVGAQGVVRDASPVSKGWEQSESKGKRGIDFVEVREVKVSLTGTLTDLVGGVGWSGALLCSDEMCVDDGWCAYDRKT